MSEKRVDMAPSYSASSTSPTIKLPPTATTTNAVKPAGPIAVKIKGTKGALLDSPEAIIPIASTTRPSIDKNDNKHASLQITTESEQQQHQRDKEWEAANTAMTAIVRADLIEARMEEARRRRQAIWLGAEDSTMTTPSSSSGSGSGSGSGSNKQTPTIKPNDILSGEDIDPDFDGDINSIPVPTSAAVAAAVTSARWPPYPRPYYTRMTVAQGIIGNGISAGAGDGSHSNRLTTATVAANPVSPGVLSVFNPPPPGFKVPSDPRKVYDEAIYSLEWGYWKQGVEVLSSLASIGFVPAKKYFDPAYSPMKNPTGASFIAKHLHKCGDLELAFIWYRRCAEAGDPTGALELAKMLVSGIALWDPNGVAVVTKDEDTDDDDDDEDGDGDSKGIRYLVQPDPGEAMAWFHRAWDRLGTGEAAYYIGKMYAVEGEDLYDSDSRDVTSVTSVRIPTSSSSSSGPISNVDPPWAILDPALAAGKSVHRDMAKGTLWFMRAIERGHHGAEVALAEVKMTGADGNGVNLGGGFRLLRRAARARVPRGMFLLGLCYWFGLGTRVDEGKAMEWLRRAKEEGGGFCDVVLGKEKVDREDGDFEGDDEKGNDDDESSSSSGWGSERNKAIANGILLLRKAAENGVPKAMYVLGLCLTKGFGGRRDITEGNLWLRKAAEAGWTEWGYGAVEEDVKRLQEEEDELEKGRSKTKNVMQLAPQAPKQMSKVSPELIAAAAAAALAATGGSMLGTKFPLPSNLAPLVPVVTRSSHGSSGSTSSKSPTSPIRKSGDLQVPPIQQQSPDSDDEKPLFQLASSTALEIPMYPPLPDPSALVSVSQKVGSSGRGSVVGIGDGNVGVYPPPDTGPLFDVDVEVRDRGDVDL
ncbi:hypothetical protein HDU76_001563 [Blyttiomyces sp. JEL0837]|nr:hypothetical protein HDU76_001563 [Blyttiomyces sp. JEL0837]